MICTKLVLLTILGPAKKLQCSENMKTLLRELGFVDTVKKSANTGHALQSKGTALEHILDPASSSASVVRPNPYIASMKTSIQLSN